MNPSAAPLAPVTLRDGRTAAVRPLQRDDVEALTAYFVSLSEETRRRYGPHPFDRPTAERFCAAWDDPQTTRFLAVLDAGTPEAKVIAYMILTREVWADDVALRRAPGPGPRCLPGALGGRRLPEPGPRRADGRQVLAWARAAGLRQVILMGGVQAPNERAYRLYQSLGFERVGEFWTRNGELLNYDMIVTWG
jgi:RimJ/RimL family protein N-acetyltransferase